MGVIVSYDVSDNNPAMKQEMINKEYQDFWWAGPEGKKTKRNLPASTLWNETKTVSQGIKDMQDATAKLNIKLLRAVASSDVGAIAIEGAPL